jgi:hypothetical protein
VPERWEVSAGTLARRPLGKVEGSRRDDCNQQILSERPRRGCRECHLTTRGAGWNSATQEVVHGAVRRVDVDDERAIPNRLDSDCKPAADRDRLGRGREPQGVLFAAGTDPLRDHRKCGALGRTKPFGCEIERPIACPKLAQKIVKSAAWQRRTENTKAVGIAGHPRFRNVDQSAGHAERQGVRFGEAERV